MSQLWRGQTRLVSVPAPAPSRGYPVDALTGAIADGELDPQLLMLQERSSGASTRWRHGSTATALLELSLGDRVEINDTARPKYLHGARGTVAGLAGQYVVVSLDRPIGRFQSARIRCHPPRLDRLGTGRTRRG
jgi:hypothetical protein